MNKDLDNLFEQARQSLQSELPLEKVQELIHVQTTPSLWSNQKFWIMNTSILAIIAIYAALFFSNYNEKNTPLTNNNDNSPTTTVASTNNQPPTFAKLNKAIPDNLPLPIVRENPNEHKLAEVILTEEAAPKLLQSADKLDSLGPKKTFTEYKLEIKKENSEQEIKKLKSDLAQYGIHMEIQELTYNDNKIQRFKGKFQTDSLFCGSTMDNYEFDISGSFHSMEFIFRVSDERNLKYLKIQSEAFEETIECYDDEVIANTKEAEQMRKRMAIEMERAQEEMERAQDEMERAQEEMERAQEEMERAQEEMERAQEEMERDREEALEKVEWDKIYEEIDKAMEGTHIDPEMIHKEVRKALKNIQHETFDNEEFREQMRDLQIDLNNMRIEISREVNREVRDAIRESRRAGRKGRVRIIEGYRHERTAEEMELEALEMKREAEALAREAKILMEEAKMKEKEAKEKAKKSK